MTYYHRSVSLDQGSERSLVPVTDEPGEQLPVGLRRYELGSESGERCMHNDGECPAGWRAVGKKGEKVLIVHSVVWGPRVPRGEGVDRQEADGRR